MAQKIISVKFENEIPIIYIKHKHYGYVQHRKLSEISGETFKKLQKDIYKELVLNFKSLKDKVDKREINNYLNIINTYKIQYWKDKRQITDLKHKINNLEKKFRKLLIDSSNLEYVNSCLTLQIKKYKKNEHDFIKKISDKDKTIFELFNSIQNKKEYLHNNPNPYIAKLVCGNCLEICENKTKCIHLGCIGLCKECTDSESKDICLSCNKKREIECPICFEICKETNVFKNPSGKCEHSICYKCFQSSFYDAKKPIEKCPLCREDFVKI